MYSWKDKVSDKLSHLFSDSSSSSPAVRRHPQATQYSKEGRYLSSIFSFILPSTNISGIVSNNHQRDLKPIQSLPVRWNSRSLSWREEPLDSQAEYDYNCVNEGTLSPHKNCKDHGFVRRTQCDDNEMLNTHEETGVPGSGRSTSGSDKYEDATSPPILEKFIPSLTYDSHFISWDLYEFFQSSLPNIVKGRQWVLLYSTEKHGISLRTLIRKSADLSGPCLLITGDMQGAVFGGLLECPIKPTAKRKYQGTNQTFVFTSIYGEPRLFRPTGTNRYFFMCLNDFLALGGGGDFALRLDGDLLTGTSGPCETFGNLCLAHSQEFELKNVELWGFTHSSQYIS